ncbi:MAG: hypothetical protein ABTQ34_02045 [Bdellovibrionales bacterium]
MRRFLPTLSILLMGILIYSCCMTNTARAESAPPAKKVDEVQIRTGAHTAYDRIVFDWPIKVGYALRREDASVSVVFESTVRFRQTAIEKLTRVQEFSSRESGDNQTEVTWKVDPNSVVKHFVNERSIVVDIEGKPVPKATTSNAPAQQTEHPPPTKQAEAEPKTNAQELATPTIEKEPASAPSATAQPASPPPITQPTATPEITAQPSSTIEQSASEPEKTAQDKPHPPSVPFPAPALLTHAIPPPVTTPNNFPPAPKIAIGSAPILVASLNPQTSARAAVWQRAGYGYIVFDRQFSLDLATLMAEQPPARVALEPLPGIKFSGYRFRMPYDALLLAQREDSIWKLFITRKKPDVPVSTALVAQPDFALGARMILPLPDAPESIRMTDPVVGDEIIVVPLERAEIFGVKRRMADLEILPAAQGLIVKPVTDKILVRKVPDGIEITAEGGLQLSRAVDTGAAQRSANRSRMIAAGKSLFDFSTWQGKPTETFTVARQRLQQAIVDVPETERNRARLELARFYFARGYGHEALAILNWLGKQMPDLKAHADFVALSGAAKILAGRAAEGLRELDSNLFVNQPEIALWQAVALAEMRDWNGAEERFVIVQPMLASYPEPFFSRFSTLAVESALATDKSREAAEWLELLLSNSRPENRNEAAIEYLRGAIHARANRYNMAEQAWNAATSMRDHLYKIRAELALIDLHIANKTLAPAKAANRLESLRFAWRGDDLEVDILHRLEQYYLQADNIKMALNTLSRVQDLFPDSAYVPQMQGEMAQIFRDIFLGDLGAKISPLEALTYYQQYRNLMPSGEKGIAVMRILAERLVAVDLLEQAGDILDDLARNKLQGEDKIHVATRLAAIRLLDGKPDKAVAALDLVKDSGGNAESLGERMLLRAKAQSEMRKYDEAIELLRDQNSQPTKILRAEIAMKGQKWPDAAKYLLQLIGPPPTEKTPLSREQASQLINAAIAMALSGDTNAIDQLAIDYGPAMDKTPQSDTFRVLTQPDKLGQLQDLADVQSRLTDLDMFQGFLNVYRKPETRADTGTAPQEVKPPAKNSAPQISPPSLAQTETNKIPEHKPALEPEKSTKH